MYVHCVMVKSKNVRYHQNLLRRVLLRFMFWLYTLFVICDLCSRILLGLILPSHASFTYRCYMTFLWCGHKNPFFSLLIFFLRWLLWCTAASPDSGVARKGFNVFFFICSDLMCRYALIFCPLLALENSFVVARLIFFLENKKLIYKFLCFIFL